MQKTVFTSIVLLGFLSISVGFSAEEKEASKPENKPLPSSVDLRPQFEKWELPLGVQGDRTTCSVFTILGAVEFAVGKHAGKSRTLSVDYANWAKNQQTGSKHDGGLFSDIWKGFRKHGVCSDAKLPYRLKYDPNREPDDAAKAEAEGMREIPFTMHWIKRWNPNTGLTEQQFQAIKAKLADGWPVCTGLRWPIKNAINNGTLRMVPAEEVRDGHSVLFVGYRDDETQPGGGVFILRDSDAPDPKKDEFMPYAYAREYANDALFIDLNREPRSPH